MAEENLQWSEKTEDVFKEDELKYWEVDIDGNITYKGREGAHEIANDRLLSQNWLTHMLKKIKYTEKDALLEFYFAYMRALRIKGIKSITLDVDDLYKLIK